MSSRWVRAVLIAVLVAGGWAFYRATLRPDPRGLAVWAEAALRDIFGPGVTHGEMTVDVLQGVRVRGLRVPRLPDAPPDDQPALSADEVVVRHDPLALMAGSLRLDTIALKSPVVSAHETDNGEIELDFPFDPPQPEGTAKRPPRILIEGGAFRLRASPVSTKLHPGRTLVLGNVNLDATPASRRLRPVDVPGEPTPESVSQSVGALVLRGSLRPEGIGLAPGEEITFGGQADVVRGTLFVTATWQRLRLTEQVKSLLAPELLEKLQTRQLEEGPHLLRVTVLRDPDIEAGRVRIEPTFEGRVRLDVGALPGGETIDARTREQLNELFERIQLKVKVSGSEIRVQELAASMAGGTIVAAGRIRDGGETVDVDLRITGLRLDDPALRRLIGEDALARFRATGMADATITLQREKGGPFRWEAAVDLVDATLVYLGVADPVLKTPSGNPLRSGFPYEIQHCYGRIYVDGDGARFDEIRGVHDKAEIRIRATDERARSGGPTGYVRFVGGDVEMCITIEAHNIPVDADIEEAVEGSEFAGLLDRFRPTGVVDEVVLDIVKRAVLDEVAVVELDLSSKHVDFVFADFPVPYDVAEAHVTILRPAEGEGPRGKEFHVRGRGVAAGGEVTVAADLYAADRRGRIRVEGRGVHMEGDLEKALLASPPGHGELGAVWKFLRPGGTADVVVDLPAFDDPGPPTYDVTLRDARVTLGDAEDPDRTLVVEGLAGRVEVRAGRVAIGDVRGRVADAEVTVAGSFDGGTEGRWDLDVAAKDLRVSRGLLHVMSSAAAGGRVLPEGIELRPGGRMDLTLGLHRDAVVEPEHPPSLSASVHVRRADVMARLGDLEMRVQGGFDVDGTDIRIEDLVVEGEGIEIRIPRARLDDGGLRGDLSARLKDLRVGPEVLGLLPADLRPTFAEFTKDRLLQAPDLTAVIADDGSLTIRGSLGLTAPAGAPAGGAPRGLVEFAPFEVSAAGPAGEREVRGTLLLRGLELDVGTRIEEVEGALKVDRLRVGEPSEGTAALTLSTARVAGLEIREARIPLVWREDILTAGPIEAAVYEGRLDGEVRVHTAAPVSFEGRLAIDGLSLATLAEDLGGAGTVAGRGTLEVEFQSRGPSFGDLTAAGTVSVCDGNLGDLPVIATIPALFASVVPGGAKPQFTRAWAEFVLADQVLDVPHVRLGGPIFDMWGHGTVDLAGRVDLTFAPQILKSFFLPGSLQIPVVRDVMWLLREDSLYLVRVHGPLRDPQTDLKPLPYLIPTRRGGPEWEPTPFEGRPDRRIPRQFR